MPERSAGERTARHRLLPRNAVPVRLVPAAASLLPDDEGARYFVQPDAAVQSKTDAGRVGRAMAGCRPACEPAGRQATT